MWNFHGSGSYHDIRFRDNEQPTDTVSQIVWNPYMNDPSFFTVGWDGFLRFYMIKEGREVDRMFEIFLEQPLLAVDVNSQNIAFVGLSSGDIAAVDLAQSRVQPLGKHDGPVIGVYWLKEKNCLISLDMGMTIKCWDINAQNQNFQQGQIKLPLKTYACACDFPYLLIASVQSTLSVVNLKNFPQCSFPTTPEHYYQLQVTKFSKVISASVHAQAKKGIIGTFDGRFMAFNFKQGYDGNLHVSDPLCMRTQKKRERIGMSKMVNTVDLGYHDYECFIVVGGGEDLGGINIRRSSKCKTYASVSQTQGSITAAKISPKQDFIAYATGSDWLQGMKELDGIKKPCLGVSKITSSELRDLVSN